MILLLSTGEISPGILSPNVKSPAQERHGPVGVHPEEGLRNPLRDGAAAPSL